MNSDHNVSHISRLPIPRQSAVVISVRRDKTGMTSPCDRIGETR